jgi:hypothetical protein
MSRPIISPPLTDRSPLLTLSGWVLIVHCPACGPKEKPVDALVEHVRGSDPLGSILPRLRCDRCRQPPSRITARCDWMAKFRAGVGPTIDLSALMAKPEAA